MTAAAVAPLATHPAPDPALAAVPGVVFNVQRYSLHDGPGIRTTVFLKGCPLRCAWCQNPESQRFEPELFFDADACVGHPACVASCPAGALRAVDGRTERDGARCLAGRSCDWACVDACPAESRAVMGRRVTAGEVFAEVVEDAIFYADSGGGLTLSGGEPLFQPRFARSLFEQAKAAGLHTTLDTSGYASWATFRSVLEAVDLVLYDFKHLDPAAHRRLTGVPNALILDNARRVRRELGLPMWARVPVVPGSNDSREDVAATAAFVARELGTDVPVHLIPFHRLGEAKYLRLGRPWPLATLEPPSETQMADLKALVESFGLETHIGG